MPNPFLEMLARRQVQMPAVTGPTQFRQPQARPGGLAGLLQRPGVSQGLLAAGSALLAQKDQPGTLGGALGRALPYGIQAGRAASQRADFEQMLEGLDPMTAGALRLLGPQQGGAILAQSMLAGPAREVVSENERIVDPNTGETIVPSISADDAVGSTTLHDALRLMGLDPTQEIPLEARGTVQDIMEQLKAAGAARTDITLPGDDSGVRGDLAEGFRASQQAVRSIARVDRALEIVDDPAFRNVSGRFNTAKEQIAAVLSQMGISEDRALALADEYRALLGALSVEELQKFGAGSGLSDRDLLEAKSIVGANTYIQPDALKAVLQVVRNSQQSTIDDHLDFLRRAERAGVDKRWIELYTPAIDFGPFGGLVPR